MRMLDDKKLALIAGWSYVVIFVCAVFANFYVLESLKSEPLATVRDMSMYIRLGILAFLLTALFDVVVAWALQEMYSRHPFSGLSTLFRMMHAGIMGVAVFVLPMTLKSTSAEAVIRYVEWFESIWLIGLFFFGMHLIILSRIVQVPRWMSLLLLLAGAAYMLDTIAHFVLVDYSRFASLFLMIVALPSVLGEMSFAVWLLLRGGRQG